MAKRARTSKVNESVAIPISFARRRLFELAEDVLTYRSDRVALSHKDYDEQLVLVRASDLAKLDADLAALRKRVGGEPFSLRGIATLTVDAEDVLKDTRKLQDALWRAKLESFRSDDVESDD